MTRNLPHDFRHLHPQECAQNAPIASLKRLVRTALIATLLTAPTFAAQKHVEERVGAVFSTHDEIEDREALVTGLRELGSNALPYLFDTLRDGHYLVLLENEPTTETLTVEQTHALLEALEGFPHSNLESFVRARCDADPTDKNRRTALRVMAMIARENDLTFCMQLAEPVESDGEIDSQSIEHLERCLKKILAESQTAFRSFRTIFERTHPGLRPSLIRAVTHVGTDAGLLTLSEFLKLSPQLQVFTLSCMSRIANSVTLPVDEYIATRIRDLESSKSPAIVRESLLLLGRLEDAESASLFIERLEDENRSIRISAHWALRHLSGLSLREEPTRWGMWLEDEDSWWRTHAPEVLNWLRSTQIKDRKRAIAIISQRRLRRSALAKELLPLLHDAEDSVVIQALSALANLGAKNVVPEVELLLEHHSDSVREHAEVILSRLR